MVIATSTVPRLDGYDPVVSRFVRTGLALSAVPIQTGKLNALNIMVKALKQFLLFDKFTAFYPLVGGLASWHSLNLVNPSTFQITWNGTVMHNEQGITGDGVTGYGDTGFIKSTVSVSYGYYTTSSDYGGTPIGCLEPDSIFAADYNSREPDRLSAEFNDQGIFIAESLVPPSSGLIVGQSLTDSTTQLWVRGDLIDSGAGSGSALTGLSVPVLADNITGNIAEFCTQPFQLFFIAETSFTSTEQSILSYIVNQYQTSLARGV